MSYVPIAQGAIPEAIADTEGLVVNDERWEQQDGRCA
jgi:hypothetical protein